MVVAQGREAIGRELHERGAGGLRVAAFGIDRTREAARQDLHLAVQLRVDQRVELAVAALVAAYDHELLIAVQCRAGAVEYLAELIRFVGELLGARVRTRQSGAARFPQPQPPA